MLDFHRCSGLTALEAESKIVKRVNVKGGDTHNQALARALALACDTVKAGGQPNPLNIGLSNYYWKDTNTNVLVLKQHIGNCGTVATIEFREGQKLQGEELNVFLSSMASEKPFEIAPETYGPMQPSIK